MLPRINGIIMDLVCQPNVCRQGPCTGSSLQLEHTSKSHSSESPRFLVQVIERASKHVLNATTLTGQASHGDTVGSGRWWYSAHLILPAFRLEDFESPSRGLQRRQQLAATGVQSKTSSTTKAARSSSFSDP
jgi:hypothetical protein